MNNQQISIGEATPTDKWSEQELAAANAAAQKHQWFTDASARKWSWDGKVWTQVQD